MVFSGFRIMSGGDAKSEKIEVPKNIIAIFP